MTRRSPAADRLAAIGRKWTLRDGRTAAFSGFGLLFAVGVACAAPLTPSEQAGKRLYHEGIAGSGATVTAQVGPQGAPVPATILPCVNCHGADGLGRPEGGIRPPAITWAELSKPYGHDHDPAAGGSGRVHPAFDEAGFARAVTAGLDPAGNRLDPAMPRYSMAASDLRDLVAYLKRIADDADPGLADVRVRIGLLMFRGAGAETQSVLRAVVQQAALRSNAAGGVHGRQIEIVEIDGGASAQSLRDALSALGQRDVFAVLMPQEPPPGIDWQATATASGVPVIGGLAPPDGNGAAGSQTYFVLPGLGDELVALARPERAEERMAAELPALVLWKGDVTAAAALASLETQLGSRAQSLVRQVVADAEGLKSAVSALRGQGVKRVLLMLPPERTAMFMEHAEAQRWLPTLLVPLRYAGSLLSGLPDRWAGRVAVSMAAAPNEVGSAARATLAAAREQARSNANPLSQLAALASTEVLVEGLKRSGRKASRKGFDAALAAMSEVPTDAGPMISYAPTRRLGAVGVHVLRLGSGGRVTTARLVRLDRE